MTDGRKAVYWSMLIRCAGTDHWSKPTVTKALGSAAWIARACWATHFSAMLSRNRW
jgi:hypothetical protein